jgi:hypothetical protein
MYSHHAKKRRTNLNILSKTLKEVAKDDSIVEKPPSTGFIPEEPKPKKAKPSKREITMEGSGVIEKQLTKKGLEFINFKNLLTS